MSARSLTGARSGRARPGDDSRFAALDAMPLLGALGIGETGMENGDLVSEDLVKIGGDCRSQTDFGNKQDERTAGIEHLAHAGEIDRGLFRNR